jgi:hypothetical protein
VTFKSLWILTSTHSGASISGDHAPEVMVSKFHLAKLPSQLRTGIVVAESGLEDLLSEQKTESWMKCKKMPTIDYCSMCLWPK